MNKPVILKLFEPRVQILGEFREMLAPNNVQASQDLKPKENSSPTAGSIGLLASIRPALRIHLETNRMRFFYILLALEDSDLRGCILGTWAWRSFEINRLDSRKLLA